MIEGSDEPTRVVVVGAGGVARRHVSTLSGLADARVVAVADPQPGAAGSLAAACGAAAYLDVEQALDATEADAVYVCVPPFAHGAPERAVLARGLPLFVEKPVGVGLDVAEELDALVAASGVVTGTGYHWRCLDTLSCAQELLASSPAMLACAYWLDKRPPVPWWAHADRSGGQVVEQLTHVLDLARVLLGEVAEVTAMAARVAADDEDRGDIDDVTAATIRFVSGAVATVAATSLLRAKRTAALHLFAPGLTLELAEDALVVDDGTSRTKHVPRVDPRLAVDREFIDAVRGGPAPRVPYAEALRTHRVACAIAESARTQRSVRLAVR